MGVEENLENGRNTKLKQISSSVPAPTLPNFFSGTSVQPREGKFVAVKDLCCCHAPDPRGHSKLLGNSRAAFPPEHAGSFLVTPCKVSVDHDFCLFHGSFKYSWGRLPICMRCQLLSEFCFPPFSMVLAAMQFGWMTSKNFHNKYVIWTCRLSGRPESRGCFQVSDSKIENVLQ